MTGAIMLEGYSLTNTSSVMAIQRYSRQRDSNSVSDVHLIMDKNMEFMLANRMPEKDILGLMSVSNI